VNAINRILLVRLGALGDIVHGLPVAAALRRAFPDARIDWLVSARHREILDHVPVIDRSVVLEPGSRAEEAPRRGCGAGDPAARRSHEETRAFTAWRGIAQAIAELREADYDIAFDLQGLLKSAILARSSGARRVVGFPVRHLRERWAHLFYTETVEPAHGVHVVDKNLALLAVVGLHDLPREFPLDVRASTGSARTELDSGPRTPDSDFALLNPGAGWPNKRWPPERFGAIAAHLRTAHALPSLVLWGPGEEDLARSVVNASGGAASLAPPTGIGDLIALARLASLLVSGDTGPLHIVAAVGTPIVGIYGPTSPGRNGPWDRSDICVSRFDDCICHHRRRCRRETCCLLDIGVDEVRAAIDRRLAAVRCPTSGANRAAARSTTDQGPAPGTTSQALERGTRDQGRGTIE
jgi:ADP-heptose:LPS heptosyltransferase